MKNWGIDWKGILWRSFKIQIISINSFFEGLERIKLTYWRINRNKKNYPRELI